jgi:hypothetical protein
MGNDTDKHSQSESDILRHDPNKARSGPVAKTQSLELISQHISEHFGDNTSVFHEIVSSLVHIDIIVVKPTQSIPFYTLVTSGMSDRPMRAPKESPLLTRAELMLSLPADWPVSEQAFKDERNYWPIRVLRILARLPHEYSTWLWDTHTVPNGDPPKRYAKNTRFCCAYLSSPRLVSEEFTQLEAGPGKIIHFHAVIPIYREEMDFKLASGSDALEERLHANNITELLSLNRTNVCKKKLFG